MVHKWQSWLFICQQVVAEGQENVGPWSIQEMHMDMVNPIGAQALS